MTTNASTTGPRSASAHELSTSGRRTSHAGTGPSWSWPGFVATLASPPEALVASGIANGGSAVPRAIGSSASVVSEL